MQWIQQQLLSSFISKKSNNFKYVDIKIMLIKQRKRETSLIKQNMPNSTLNTEEIYRGHCNWCFDDEYGISNRSYFTSGTWLFIFSRVQRNQILKYVKFLSHEWIPYSTSKALDFLFIIFFLVFDIFLSSLGRCLLIVIFIQWK